MPNLLSLDRNDEPAALEIASAAIEAGEFTPDLAQILLMLQDDPMDLLESLQRLTEGERS